VGADEATVQRPRSAAIVCRLARSASIIALRAPGVILGAATLAGLLLGPPVRADQSPAAKVAPASAGPRTSPADLGNRVLVTFGREVRAVIPTLYPMELVYPLDGAHRVELAWGIGAPCPATGVQRFTGVIRREGRRSLDLVDEKVKAVAGQPPRWFSRVVDVPADARQGTLVLWTGGTARTSFWAAPVFSRSSPGGSARNVILVSLDTVRADHLNAYGYTRRRTSPEFDDWAAKGALFENAMSTAPGTLSSQMSVLTGRYPSRHGVSYANWRVSGRMPVLRPDVPTLAEIVAAKGFLTAAFTGSGYFALPLGYSRGFGEFTSIDDETMGSAANVFEEAFTWLERHRDDPFFLFLHTYEAHQPYLERRFVEAERPGLRGRKAENEALYDGDIWRADVHVGRLRRHLDRLGLTSRTLVVLFSDHGEEFGDHFPVWDDGHGHSLFEEQVHVPLMLVGPRVPAGRREKRAVDLTVVAPTVLDALGVQPPGGMDGRSLLGALRGEPGGDEEGLAFSEDVWIGPATRALRTRDWKLVEKGEPMPERFLDNDVRRAIARGIEALAPRMLFRLSTDPREQENALTSNAPVAARLDDLLKAHRAGGSNTTPGAGIEVEGDVRDRLRALGYVE
jgi:arylsulfatase A-like enzyme